jgi:hypothetical protein
MRGGAWLCVTFSLAALGGGAAPHAAEPAAAEADPWATMRACEKVLERLVACASAEPLRALKPRWAALADPGKKVEVKDIEELVRSWGKPDERKRQCAIWTKREGVTAHVGEGSPLAKLAAEKGITCVRFARALGDDKWLPKAIVDATQARPAAATGTPPAHK